MALLLAKSWHNIDKAPFVLHMPLGPAHLLLLLFGHLGSLTSIFLAQAMEPWTLPPSMWLATSRVLRASTPHWPRVALSSRGVHSRSRT